MRLRIDISYDGTAFHGWATQPGLRTVQGSIEDAIAMILRLREPARLTCAGRTDTGVHARGQVAHIDLDAVDESVLTRRLRQVLPVDIQIRSIRPAADGFDARYSAIERHYVYRICDNADGPDPLVRRHIVWHQKPLNTGRMNAAARHLLGKHDFSPFCKRTERATTIRTLLELESVRRGDGILETTVRADAFCRSMVRSLMGALIAVGEGRNEPEWTKVILAAPMRDPQVNVMPALGLTLESVVYPANVLSGQRTTEARRDECDDSE
ncbi:MAG: tRNA pseudouridine(38-40) synthase TruA [Propionibacteriales bacterium]|nr:tRNA pseudouridine(38-40) synthase TruA [Propionibacteriales bacterium]